jgi:predicted enzyme related to lactoylglutathione lyase
MAPITGVGGVFLKCEDPKALSDWYRRVTETEYFAPSPRDCMINFAVDDLDGMIARLEEHGVVLLGREDSDPNGRFAWFLDPAAIKIELWEPKK